jgi:transaldolase
VTIKIFADGAKLGEMLAALHGGIVTGFTTNPTLMRQAGVTDYQAFARSVLAQITDFPISFEVFADDLPTMEKQARLIASWGENVYVKIPVMNTQRVSTAPLVRDLAKSGIKLNVTAILTPDQVGTVVAALAVDVPAVVSVFAGRIADTGVDPVPLMRDALKLCRAKPKAELLWASSREVLNIHQADEIGCHIITVPPDLLKKLSLRGKDLSQYSLETVETFYRDAKTAGFQL